MSDMAYIISRTLETKIAMAEHNGNNALIVTLDVLKEILALLKEQEVVRCKDCRWYDEKISFCDNCHLPREQTFFCADGKRR